MLTKVERAAMEIELEQTTGLTLRDFDDLARASPADRAAIVRGWGILMSLSWRTEPSTLARVRQILTVLAAALSPLALLAGDVEAFAGAVTAMEAL